MSKAATSDLMAELHGEVARCLLDIIRNGVIVKFGEDDEEDVRRPANAAELGAAITFLKNNSITADLEEDDALRELNTHLRRQGKKAGFHIPGADLTQ